MKYVAGSQIMPKKAKDFLQSARHLLKTSPNCAVSRSYYAIYRVVVDLMRKNGVAFEDYNQRAARERGKDEHGNDKWSHGALIRALKDTVDRKAKDALDDAYQQREKADYGRTNLNKIDAEVLIKLADEVLKGKWS